MDLSKNNNLLKVEAVKQSNYTRILLIGYILINIGWALVSAQFLPWWTGPIGAVLVAALLNVGSWKSFFITFSTFMVIHALIAWQIDQANDGLLSARIGQLFMNQRPLTLIIATGIIAGLPAGIGAWLGAEIKTQFSRPK